MTSPPNDNPPFETLTIIDASLGLTAVCLAVTGVFLFATVSELLDQWSLGSSVWFTFSFLLAFSIHLVALIVYEDRIRRHRLWRSNWLNTAQVCDAIILLRAIYFILTVGK